MKREWVGIGLLLVLLILGLLVTWRMTTVYEAMADTLEKAGTLALSEDWEGADRLLRRTRSQWEESWRLTAALTDHEPMEEVDAQLAQLEVYRQQQDSLSFAALCAQIASQMTDIGDAQALNWWNLL